MGEIKYFEVTKPSVNSSDFVPMLSDKALVAMLTSMRDIFPEEVIQAILLELSKRNLPAEQLTKLRRETENNRLTTPQPLGIFWKLTASLYGFLTYSILVVLVELLSM